jgi:hypothetical protein
MSVLRRLVVHSHAPLVLVEPERPIAFEATPVRDRSETVWTRVLDVLNRRIGAMEENIEKATDEWADLQGIERGEWEVRMRSYAYALEELHALSDALEASRSEIP